MARHRTVSPSPEECIKLGEELVAWALVEDPKKPRFRFAQWYSMIKKMPRYMWKAMIICKEFVPYYEEVQNIFVHRVLDPKVLDKSFGHRYIRLYDRELIEAENEQAKIDADLKRKNEEQSQDEFINKLREAISDTEKLSRAEET